MKKLSKIKLEDVVILEDQEMKLVSGGSGGLTGGCFKCSCNGQINPPYNSPWYKFYINETDIPLDILVRCADGGGCTQTSILYC